MNIDEDEVTREPFEDQTNGDDGEEEDEEGLASISSWQQPRYDSQSTVPEEENKDELDTTDDTLVVKDEHESSIDDCNSSVCEEDINFAKSFGINLKSSKSQASYDRLIKSDLFESAPRTSEQLAANKLGPTIKTSVTSDCIYHKGCFYQKGDIVALCDQDDGLIYFAQLTGFLQDQNCEKSASINWLVPTRPTSRKFFDPSAYRIGLEDVQLRKLDCMTFVRHCPHDYYLRKFFQSSQNTDQPSSGLHQGEDNETAATKLDTNYKKNNKNQTYIWTTMRPCSVPTIETNRRLKIVR